MGLGILSSGTMEVLKGLKLRSVTLSPELDAAEVRSIQKHIPAELVVYGRVPMALAEPGLSIEGFDRIPDRDGIAMPILKGYGGRETLYSAKKLFLARHFREYMSSGLYGVRLSFTTESEGEAVSVTERYLGLGKYEPANFTRGLF